MNTEQIVTSFFLIHTLLSVVVYCLELDIFKLIIEGLLMALILLFFIFRTKKKLVFIIQTLLSFNIFIIGLIEINSSYIFIHFVGWFIVTRKFLKINKTIRLLHSLLIIISSIYQIWRDWSSNTYQAIIHMQGILSFSACYCYYEYQIHIKQNNTETFQSSQKVISEDFHRFLTTRRSMNTLCSDFVVLDIIPHGVVLLTCKYEFQHINEKAIDQIYGLTGIKPNEDNVVDLINSVLKGLLSKKNSPKNKSEKQVSQLISPQNIINVDSYDDIKPTPLEHIINNQKGSSIMTSKLITTYQSQGKMRSVKFQIQKQELPNIIIILILDVTSKIERQNQEKKYKFQHQLLNSFSHELRTPLNCSQQLLESLIVKQQNEEQLKSLYQIFHQNDLLLCQINDILDYASMETDNFHSFYSVFTLDQLFNQCHEMYEQGCKLKNINLNIKNTVYPPIRNDCMRIKQVLVNLINNSIKFCSYNGIITIQAKEKIKNDKKLTKIKVKDNGIGFTSSQLALINHVLEQNNDYFDATTSMCIGLGLKVANKQVKSFIKGYNRLKIISIQNQKTSVSFYIEDQIDEQDLDCQSRASKTLFGNLSTMTNSEYKFISALKCKCSKILVVDDIPFNHQALQIMLSAFNQTCDHAFDGLEAFQCVHKRLQTNKCHPYYQLILMDIEMPKMNGFDSAIKITELLDKNKHQTKIVMCTAYDNLESRQIAKQCMIDDYLPKPIQRSNLLNILNIFIK
ncbi:unnamed protein product [Paramecium pentaurelia]|uniref:Uncharacterized protein n=1 Tax=Paramecium pentaurelia TaxID=43138 RepID=A0A8S1XGM8_9CILI|nr:unnamed protein product [Paramecium pentaurelia]